MQSWSTNNKSVKPLLVELPSVLANVETELDSSTEQNEYPILLKAVDNFSKIAAGKGGFWEDRGYEWYAGI